MSAPFDPEAAGGSQVLIRGQIFRGISWASGTRLFGLVLQMASAAVIARYLASGDIGLIGFAAIFIAFLSRFTNFGIEAAIIQRGQLDGNVLTTAFTLQGALAVTAFVASLMIAPFGQVLIGHEGAGGVIVALGSIFLINVLGFIPTCLLTRELNYGRLSLAQASRALGRGLFVIGLVLLGFGYWGIVIADIVAAVVFLLSLGWAHPWVLRPGFDKNAARALLNFAAPIFACNLLVFVLFNADNFAIGSVLGATMLGYYVIAFNWGSMICGILGETVNSVLFPAFSKIQKNIDEMRHLYLKTLERVGFVAVLVNTCLLAGAHDFLVVFLGKGSEKWLPAVTCLQVLSVYGMLRALTEPLANVMLALGKTRTLFTANVVAALIELGLMAPALYWYGINGVSVLVLIAYGAQLWLYVPFVLRQLSMRLRELLGIVVPLAIASGVSVYATSLALPHGSEVSWLSLALRVVVTAITVMLVHGVLTSFRIFRDACEVVAWIARSSRGAPSMHLESVEE